VEELTKKKKWLDLLSIIQIIAIIFTIAGYIYYFVVYVNTEGQGTILLFPWFLFIAIGSKRMVKKSFLSLANKKIDTLRLDYENNIIDEETYRELTEKVRTLIYKVS